MKRLGVSSPVCGDVFALPPGDYDTILMLNRGLGMCRRLERFERMLHHLESLLSREGQVVADSMDIRESPHPLSYRGDLRLRLRYRQSVGDWFDWLYIDSQTL